MRGPEAFDVGALCETGTLENFCSRGAEYLATDDTLVSPSSSSEVHKRYALNKGLGIEQSYGEKRDLVQNLRYDPTREPIIEVASGVCVYRIGIEPGERSVGSVSNPDNDTMPLDLEHPDSQIAQIRSDKLSRKYSSSQMALERLTPSSPVIRDRYDSASSSHGMTHLSAISGT